MDITELDLPNVGRPTLNEGSHFDPRTSLSAVRFSSNATTESISIAAITSLLAPIVHNNWLAEESLLRFARSTHCGFSRFWPRESSRSLQHSAAHTGLRRLPGLPLRPQPREALAAAVPNSPDGLQLPRTLSPCFAHADVGDSGSIPEAHTGLRLAWASAPVAAVERSARSSSSEFVLMDSNCREHPCLVSSMRMLGIQAVLLKLSTIDYRVLAIRQLHVETSVTEIGE